MESSHFLVEFESLKSKESIYKMKETNFLRDKEILEESVKNLQSELQEKSIENRQLRRDLELNSNKLVCDLENMSDESDKLRSTIDELKKENIILQESLKHQAIRHESIKGEFEKHKEVFERESSCKSKLAEFYEASFRQKEQKNIQLKEEADILRVQLRKIEHDFTEQQRLSSQSHEQLASTKRELSAKLSQQEVETEKVRTELQQLQQNGISEQELEKLNPRVANTLKMLKSSTSLMQMYSELHARTLESEQLGVQLNHTQKSSVDLSARLTVSSENAQRLQVELRAANDERENLRRRVIGLAEELRQTGEHRQRAERRLLLTDEQTQETRGEIDRLREQVRLLLVSRESGLVNLKREELDEASGLCLSVAELQEANWSLRREVDELRTEGAASQREEERVGELEREVVRVRDQLEAAGREASVCRRQAQLHERQVSALMARDSLGRQRSIAEVAECGVQVELDNHDAHAHQKDKLQLQQEVRELIDNKHASDNIYQQTIEDMRVQLRTALASAATTQDQLERSECKLNGEREMCQRAQREADLLRVLNEHAVMGGGAADKQMEEIKAACAVARHELAVTRTEMVRTAADLMNCRSSEVRLKIRLEAVEAAERGQTELGRGLESVGRVVALRDTVELGCVRERLRETLEKLEEMETELGEARAREEQARLVRDTRVDFECQLSTVVESGPVDDHEQKLYELQTKLDQAERQQLVDLKVVEEEKSQLSVSVAELQADNQELKKNCDFSQSQIVLLEKARQEIISENIKLTDENQRVNTSLQDQLACATSDLESMRVRLTQAEHVEQTAQSVIDRHARDCTEAKVKYQRELTLHAADSKLLTEVVAEADRLRECVTQLSDETKSLNADLDEVKSRLSREMSQALSQMREVEDRLQESELRNDRLYNQLCQISSGGSRENEYAEIIQDLRTQISVSKLTSNLGSAEVDRYELQLGQLRTEVTEMRRQQHQKNQLHQQDLQMASGPRGDSCVELDVAVESNHLLREQKTALERNNLEHRAKIRQCDEKISKLQHEVENLTDEKKQLSASNATIELERSRWKERCSKLMERAEQMDPEQYRLVCNERDKLKKHILVLETEVEQLKTEKNKLKSDLEAVQSELEAEKQNRCEKETIMVQLKEIARKYKGESEKRRQNTEELELKINEMNQCHTEDSCRISQLTADNNDISQQLTDNSHNLAQLTANQKELEDQLKEKCEYVSQLTESSNSATKENLEKIQQLTSSNCELVRQLQDRVSTLARLTDMNNDIGRQLADKISEIIESRERLSSCELELKQRNEDLAAHTIDSEELKRQLEEWRQSDAERTHKLVLRERIVVRMQSRLQQLQGEKRKRDADEYGGDDDAGPIKKARMEDVEDVSMEVGDSNIGVCEVDENIAANLIEFDIQEIPSNEELMDEINENVNTETDNLNENEMFELYDQLDLEALGKCSEEETVQDAEEIGNSGELTDQTASYKYQDTCKESLEENGEIMDRKYVRNTKESFVDDEDSSEESNDDAKITDEIEAITGKSKEEGAAEVVTSEENTVEGVEQCENLNNTDEEESDFVIEMQLNEQDRLEDDRNTGDAEVADNSAEIVEEVADQLSVGDAGSEDEDEVKSVTLVGSSEEDEDHGTNSESEESQKMEEKEDGDNDHEVVVLEDSSSNNSSEKDDKEQGNNEILEDEDDFDAIVNQVETNLAAPDELSLHQGSSEVMTPTSIAESGEWRQYSMGTPEPDQQIAAPETDMRETRRGRLRRLNRRQ